MSGHTPGPWKMIPESFEQDGPALPAVYREPSVVAGERTVAIVRVGLKGTEANARLIAAAPELLEALGALADASLCFCGREGEEGVSHSRGCILARAAIAKASA